MPQDRPVIAHVLHRLYLAGAEVLAGDLARRMDGSRQGSGPFRYAFFCLDEIGPFGDELAEEGFDVINLHRQPGVDLAVAQRMAEHCKRLGVSLLHAHQYTPFFYASLSRAWPTRFGPFIGSSPPVLFTEHGRHYPDYRRPKRVFANRFLLRRRDRVTAVGHWVKQCLVDNEGIDESRIEVVHNGIDPEAFLPLPPEIGREVRDELRIDADRPVIMQVARFHPVKDHATAIRAMAVVHRRVPEALLVLVGDGDERAAMGELVGELGINDAVRFLGVRSDVPRLMAAADVFMLSSLSEGISVTLLEAMGAAVPIVATDVGGNSEVVADGHTGLLSPRRDADALAENLIALLQSPERREAMGQAGRQRLLEMFTQERMHARYEAIYEEMLG